VKIMLVCSAFNGLSQRVWAELRAAGHSVRVQLAGEAEAMCAAVADHRPDLIICPFLRERVPARIWQTHRTIIIHPGPPGDRGPSSLDWAILGGEREWGVTAVQAVEEMDAGPIWGSRIFPIDPTEPPPVRAASTAGRWPMRRSSSSTRSSSGRPIRGSCPPRSTIAAPRCAAGCGR
jgi:putative two-component system protein, hydrogenase maturation factor HypX/HoxX